MKDMHLDEDTRQALEDRAKELHSRRRSLPKRQRRRRKPVVVEFAGSPKSGKTTNIDIISHFFKRMKFKIWAPAEGASKRTPYHLKRDLVAFNTWSLNYAISELLVAYHNVDRHDLIILDRGPFDSLAWMNLLNKQNKLQADELKIIEAFALHPKWFSLISRVYLFTCKPAMSLQRELESKLTHGAGTAMNEGMLQSLLEEYEVVHGQLNSYPVQKHDTTETEGPLATAEPIAQDILTLMEEAANVK